MRALIGALLIGGAVWALPAYAKTWTCTEVFGVCMQSGMTLRGNHAGGNNLGARCKNLRTSCMRTGEWDGQYHHINGVRRE